MAGAFCQSDSDAMAIELQRSRTPYVEPNQSGTNEDRKRDTKQDVRNI